MPSPQGDYWLAVGVKFDSFKMADSFALFSVSFGTRLQFALLGLTKLTVPTGAAADKCAVYAELAIRAVLDPEAGVFSIEGRLTQNSYVFWPRSSISPAASPSSCGSATPRKREISSSRWAAIIRTSFRRRTTP